MTEAIRISNGQLVKMAYAGMIDVIRNDRMALEGELARRPGHAPGIAEPGEEMALFCQRE